MKRQLDIQSSTKVSASQLRIEAVKSKKNSTTIRLLALADAVDGESFAIIAKRYSVSKSSIYYWMRCLSDRGIDGIVHSPRRGRKCNLDNRHGIGYEALISAARGADRKASVRLIAISQLLKKVPCGEVARDAHVTPSTLTSWIRKFNARGIAGLLSTDRRRAQTTVVMRKDISGTEVRGAARIASHRTSRRLMAVADVLDGKKLAEVAGSLDISVSAVSKWCRRFNEDGIEGLVCRWEARAGRVATAIG